VRSTLSFNHGWLYLPEADASQRPDADFERVTLPHSNVILPHNNFDDQEYQFSSSYRKRFTLPEPLNGRRLFIDFEGAATATTLTLNGQRFAEHRGGYVPFSFDLTDFIDEDGENVLEVMLDSRERADVPPWGFMVDYMGFGGIYREVSLRYVAPIHIENVHVKTYGVVTGKRQVEFRVHLRNLSDAPQAVVVVAGMAFWHDEIAQATVQPGTSEVVTLWSDLTDFPDGSFELWSPQSPRLYDFTIHLSADAGFGSVDEQQLDAVTVRSGFRQAEWRDDGFYLNGERLQLRGLNRHQMYPYIGAAAPARLQRRDADIIRYELGCNLVRTSHYPQSRHFLDRCDEIGLLVFEEIPGWQYLGGAEWQELVLRDVRAMIERDWNRPSIILWGVRINESWDNHDLYTRTNALAHELDPTRATGGVRFFMGSEFLEDVYTLNDFSNGVQEPQETPHLITEFNGHMFPTKSYDHDTRLIEHALRHLRIQAQAATTGGVSGAIGWCAFDYNTHKEFGAGDRICHHGVMDIFRLPKYAAYAYGSQIDPSERIVLFAATNWRLGDVDEGLIQPIYVFSNCDEIEVFVGDQRKGRYQPDHDSFPNLPHPPFKVDGLDVMLAFPYGDLRVVGYIGGEPVAEQRIANDGVPHTLRLWSDDAVLRPDDADMTRVTFAVTDAYGTPLRYAATVVTLTVEGPGQLIGTNPFPLIGGQAALYLKAGLAAGDVIIRAEAPRLQPAEIRLAIRDEALAHSGAVSN